MSLKKKTFCLDQMIWYKQFYNKIIIFFLENIWVI